MKTQDIINALRTTESRSKRTLLDAAASALEHLTDRCARYAEEIAVLQDRQRWIPVDAHLPEGDDAVLAVVSGKPTENITLIGSVQIAVYCAEAGWFIAEFPGWDEPTVTHWMPLPAAPEVEGWSD